MNQNGIASGHALVYVNVLYIQSLRKFSRDVKTCLVGRTTRAVFGQSFRKEFVLFLAIRLPGLYKTDSVPNHSTTSNAYIVISAFSSKGDWYGCGFVNFRRGSACMLGSSNSLSLLAIFCLSSCSLAVLDAAKFRNSLYGTVRNLALPLPMTGCGLGAGCLGSRTGSAAGTASIPIDSICSFSLRAVFAWCMRVSFLLSSFTLVCFYLFLVNVYPVPVVTLLRFS
jgi:hypothetical protein